MVTKQTVVTPDLDEVLVRVRRVAEMVAEPEAERVDREAVWPEASIEALREAGLNGLVVPVTAGGLGMGLSAMVHVCEVLGSACASTAMCFGMHCVGSAVIAARHTPDQRRELLEPIARGEHLTTLALSEPGTGSHFYLPESRLHHEKGHYQLTGRKMFVTNGNRADSYVVSTAPGEQDAPPGMFSCVVVPAQSKGITWGEPWEGLGMRGNASLTMNLNAVPIPAENLLGQEGDQMWFLFNVVAPYFLMAMAGTYLGVTQGAFQEARQHLITREHTHNGLTLAQQPLIQHQVGEMWARIERTRRLVLDAASRADAGDEAALPAVLSAKAEVASTGVRTVDEAMTLSGGSGYRSNGKLGRSLRDIRAAHVMAPTTERLRTWVGRVLLNQPMLRD